MIKKILAVISAIGAFFSAVFFLMFKNASNEKKVIKKENEDLKDNLEAIVEADKAVNREKKANEKLLEKVHSSNKLDSFNACNELLQK